MSKKLLLFLVVAIAAIVALVYFFRFDAQPVQPAETSILTENAPAPCPYDANFCRYLSAQANALQKGIVMDMTSQATTERVETNIRLDGAGNMMSQTFVDGKFTAGITVYAGLTYVLDLQDQYWFVINPDIASTDAAQQSFLDEIKNTYDPDFAAQALTINYLGEEVDEQVSYLKYEIINQVGDAGVVSKTYLWIDKSTFLAAKMELIDETTSMLATYRYEEVRISKPDPIKEMPKLVFPGEVGDPGQGASTGAVLGTADDSSDEVDMQPVSQDYALDR